MSETHCRGKIAQKAILIKDGKVLITRDSRDTLWELPGGRLDAGEEPIDGMVREIREELGVEAKIDKIFKIETMYHSRDKETLVFIYYTVFLVDEGATFKVDPLEVAEMKWVDQDGFMKYEMYPQYKEAVKDYFKKTVS